MYEPDVFKSIKDIEQLTNQLTKLEREKLLVSHPCLSARLFKIKQKIKIWFAVINWWKIKTEEHRIKNNMLIFSSLTKYFFILFI